MDEPPTIQAFNIGDRVIPLGATTTLSWQVTDATSLSIDNGIGEVTGQSSIPIAPTEDTIYTLTATNGAGSVTAQVDVDVFYPPVISLFTSDVNNVGYRVPRSRFPGR
ncbi:MAG: hypothetical protein R3F11_19330 [Verrucomicrobiales bacterium]